MDAQEFMELMEVQINKAEEKMREKALYDLGVAKMNEVR